MSVREKAVTFVKKPLVIASSLMLASGPVLAEGVSYTPDRQLSTRI